jgi:hypothetical protein
MGWTIAVSEGEGIVHAVASGAVTMDTVRRIISEGMDLAVKHDANRFVADLRAVTSHVSTVQIYLLPRLLESLGLRRDSRVALVIGPDARQESDYRFYQTVSENQGYMIGLFHDLDAARQWLTADPPSR